jgi:hypothetical protein
MHATEAAAAAETRLTATLSRIASAVISEARAQTRVAVSRGLVKGAGGRSVVIRRVRRDSVRLAIHASLATVRTEASLTVSRVVLVIVRVAVVGMVVARVLLTVRLRLGSRSSLLLLLGLLGLASRVRSVVAAVLGIGSARSKAGLALRVLAEVIRLLSCIVTTEPTLLGGSVVGLSLAALLLAELLAVVVVVGVAVVLTSSVVRGVLARRRAEGSCGLLRLGLRSGCREVVEGRLRGRGLLREGVLWLRSRGNILRSRLAISTKLCVRCGGS